MIQVNAMGDACPIPVVKTLQALKELHGAGTVQTLVDNKVAVENLTRLAESKGCTIETAQLGEKEYRVTITVGEGAELPETVDTTCAVPAAADNTVVAVSADHMGEGDEVLGRILLKGFLFALTQQETLPKTVLFYNGGAKLTVEGSPVLDDLKGLAEQGVEILTCGTCLDHYGIKDQLAVGEVTNMYVIVEKMEQAVRVVRP